MEQNVIRDKSFAFSTRVVRVYQYLTKEKSEYTLSRQLLRSGTSIGANVVEALNGFSRSDFLFKLCTALKETSESAYRLEMLHQTDYLSEKQYNSLIRDCREIQRLLTSIIKTTRHNMRNGGSD